MNGIVNKHVGRNKNFFILPMIVSCANLSLRNKIGNTTSLYLVMIQKYQILREDRFIKPD